MIQKQKQNQPIPSDYMNAKDVYAYFGKRVSFDKCLELLHTGQIRSANIGGKWLTKKQYVEEYEQTIFLRTSAPTLTFTHKTLQTHKAKQQYLLLKQR